MYPRVREATGLNGEDTGLLGQEHITSLTFGVGGASSKARVLN